MRNVLRVARKVDVDWQRDHGSKRLFKQNIDVRVQSLVWWFRNRSLDSTNAFHGWKVVLRVRKPFLGSKVVHRALRTHFISWKSFLGFKDDFQTTKSSSELQKGFGCVKRHFKGSEVVSGLQNRPKSLTKSFDGSKVTFRVQKPLFGSRIVLRAEGSLEWFKSHSKGSETVLRL